MKPLYKASYKTVNALLAASLIPVLIFMPFIKLITTSDTLNKTLSQYGIGEQISLMSLKNAIQTVMSEFSGKDTELNFSADFFPVTTQRGFIIFAVCLVIAILCMLLVIIFGTFTKKKGLTAGFAAGGMISTFIMNYGFDMLGTDFISGKADLMKIYGQITGDTTAASFSGLVNDLIGLLGEADKTLGNLANALVGDYAKIDIRVFRLSDAYTFMLIIFGAVAVFNVVVYFYEKNK